MATVMSAEELTRFTYSPLTNGEAIVYLRENIEQVTDETEEGTATYWQADEIQVITDLKEDEIEDNFDTLWVRGETDAKPVKQRLNELEEWASDLTSVILGIE